MSNGKTSLKDFLNKKIPQSFSSLINEFSSFIKYHKMNKEHSYFRLISTAPGSKIHVLSEDSNQGQNMLLFASNNYLGLGNNDYIKKKVIQTIDKYGTGLGGPPILNGYTKLMNDVEQRLARLKNHEDCMIFSAGFNANLGFVSALVKNNDLVIFDELSHASLYDALKMNNAKKISFSHNDVNDLKRKLAENSPTITGSIFVCIEGIYSMDGDISPLNEIIPVAKQYGAITVLDDAHGLGILGVNGSGTAEHFGASKDIDIIIGTFSKTLAGTGGFLTGNKNLINYMRYFARPYVFSAALPPMSLAAVLAGLDVIESDPHLRERLKKNINYAQKILSTYDIVAKQDTPIIALLVPEWMNIRKANSLIHDEGIFLNAIEYPAVPKNKQRFRITLMSQHTKEDIDKLAQTLAKIWADPKVRFNQS